MLTTDSRYRPACENKEATATETSISAGVSRVAVSAEMRDAGADAIAGYYLDLTSSHREGLLAEIAAAVFQAMTAAQKPLCPQREH